jgi:uncharacterized protein YdhG (YjbR/CyaY superfamily)
MKTFKNVDDYILSFPKETQLLLEEIRTTIRKAAPKAEEIISYGMPAYKLNGALVYFAGYKGHLGFYPTPSGIANFKKELSAYQVSKGTVQFPLDKKLPHTLIFKIVKFRVQENQEKIKAKALKKSSK